MPVELPRCAVCRTRIAPQVNVTFRPDGRVEHVSCPTITCPVCSKEILGHQPIRRDGEDLVHGNCWVRRFRQAAKVMAGGAGAAPLIRAKLSSGALPAMAPTKIWGQRRRRRQRLCRVRGVAQRRNRVRSGVRRLWDEEHLRLGRGIGGGSAASPWTLFFDAHVTRRARYDDAALKEMFIATAEVWTASAAGRDHVVRARHRSIALQTHSERLRLRSCALSSGA